MRGEPILAVMARDGVYRSQFETGTGNGGLTAHPGGDRWRWESRIFGGAYDDAEPARASEVRCPRPAPPGPTVPRPASGRPTCGWPRTLLERTTFCFPDSVFEPELFGTATAFALAEPLAACRAEPRPARRLRRGPRARRRRARPGRRGARARPRRYRGTDVEADALELGVRRRVAPGLPARRRDPARPPGLPRARSSSRSASRSPWTASSPRGSSARRARAGRHDEQSLKRVWHYVARFGPAPPDSRPADARN